MWGGVKKPISAEFYTLRALWFLHTMDHSFEQSYLNTYLVVVEYWILSSMVHYYRQLHHNRTQHQKTQSLHQNSAQSVHKVQQQSSIEPMHLYLKVGHVERISVLEKGSGRRHRFSPCETLEKDTLISWWSSSFGYWSSDRTRGHKSLLYTLSDERGEEYVVCDLLILRREIDG
jgi:hypothetical protein